jgi:predicted N-acetyltransferase YhbS
VEGVSVRRLQQGDDVAEFSCDVPELEAYLREYAREGEAGRYSSTFVAIKDEKVVGFATVTADMLFRGRVNTDGFAPHQSLPIMLLTHIAVETRLQKQGIGSELMATVLQQVPHMAEMPGCLGLFLDSRQQSMVFYEKLGFVPMEPKDAEYRPMFMERGAIEGLLEAP